MTIRWKLNLSVLGMIAVFLGAAALSIYSVSNNAEQTRAYSRMRDSAQLTADLRTQMYQHVVLGKGAVPRDPTGTQDWLEYAAEHTDIQVRLAESESERNLWAQVGTGLQRWEAASSPLELERIVERIDRQLRDLRHYYDLAQARSIAQTAETSLLAQAAIGLACVLAVMLFLVHLLTLRQWLVRPLEILKNSADLIGQGRLEHRVPLEGGDELAQLARRVDAMAENLAAHQAALIQARELSALGELCANVAHGLRNPLAALRASVQLAEKRANGSVETQSLIRELSQQADRMDQRITRLFQFSRPMELRPRAAGFQDVARTAKAQAFPILSARGVTLEIDDRTAGALVEIDCDQLADALAELLANAAYHSPSGSSIRLSAELRSPGNGAGQSLHVEITDQGSGMSPATLKKAFDLFFSSRSEGTGMGLALVRRFVQRNRGTVQIASQRGAGTTVSIHLPA